ncbi:MAG: NUDIX domain-containing protein [Candidatus Kapabacteria bacterium]|nr:NUDIX domain-containing protein [Candidatus Kapabacteria bacterium]
MISFISNTVQVHIAAYFEDYKGYKHLLLKRSPLVKVYPGIWQTITGTIESGENAVKTALRETMEETGTQPLRLWTLPYITRFFDAVNNSIHLSPVFGMLISPESKIILSDEHDSYEWLHLDPAIERLGLPSHREAVKIFDEYILSVNDQSLFEIKEISN